jgi:hypothetical protein
MNRDDAIAIALDAADRHDVKAARGLHTRMLGHPMPEVRRRYADEAVHRWKIRRQCVTVVLQRLIGDDLTDVECADLADELTMPCDLAGRIPRPI